MIKIAKFSMTNVVIALSLALSSTAAYAADNEAEIYRQTYKLEAAGNAAGALAKIKEVKGKGENPFFLKMRTAWLAYLAGNFALADSSYRQAISEAPKAVDARFGLAASLLAQKKWRDLVKECQQVLKLEEGNAVARARLAHAQYSLGNYPDSATAYRSLVAGYPSDLTYQTGLGWALARMGRREEARKIFTSVLAVSPDNASALEGMKL